MSTLREMCHCGHHKATHFESLHACLGLGCDGLCSEYRDDTLPKPPPPPRVRHDAIWNPDTWRYEPCKCKECNR